MEILLSMAGDGEKPHPASRPVLLLI